MGLKEFLAKTTSGCSRHGAKNDHQAAGIIESKVKYIKPPQGSNVAREIIASLKERNADKILFVDGLDGSGRELTGHELWLQMGRLATGLMQSQVKMSIGDHVLLMAEHHLREKVMLLATLATGAVVMGTAPSGYDHLRNFCEPTRPQVIVTNNQQFEFAKRLRREVAGMSKAKIILLDEEGASELMAADEATEEQLYLAQDLFDWPELDEKLITRRVQRDINPTKHHSMLMMTSGSTGRSKVVPWTHEHQLSDIWSITSASKGGVYGPEGRALVPVGDNFVMAGDLPLDQGAGSVGMLWCLIQGGKYVLIKSYDEEQYWRDVTKYKLTCNLGSSTFTYRALKKLVQWLDHPPNETIDVSSMRFIGCAGARVNIGPLMETLRPYYKNLEVTQFYAATEIGFIAMLTCEDARQSFEPVGHLFPGVRAKVVDINTHECKRAGEEGEMLVKSPGLFHQYIPHPEETLEELMRDRKDKDGFYRTGDLVHYDEEQRFYIHARLKDTLYLDQDWKTTPTEIENVINKHPLVEASVVVGVPNPEVEGCVLPKAFVKLKSPEELELMTPGVPPEDYQRIRNLVQRLKSGRHEQVIEDIFKFTAIDLAEQKHLTGGIRILEDFPRIGGFQKVDRKKLTQMD